MVHVRNGQDPANIEFNQEGARLIMNEIRELAHQCNRTDFSTLYRDGKLAIRNVFTISCRITWTLPYLTNTISAKSQRHRGYYIIALLKEGLVEVMKDLILWAVRATKAMEETEGPNYLFISQDIQEVLKFCFKVLKVLIEGTFLGFGNLQNFLVPFKTNLDAEILGQRPVELE